MCFLNQAERSVGMARPSEDIEYDGPSVIEGGGTDP